MVDRPTVVVHYLRGHDGAATNFADAADKIAPFITDWFGASREKAKTADLPDPKAASFESGALLLKARLLPATIPETGRDSRWRPISLRMQEGVRSRSGPWIGEGVAHFAQALYLEREKGRPAATDMMGPHPLALGRNRSADNHASI